MHIFKNYKQQKALTPVDANDFLIIAWIFFK